MAGNKYLDLGTNGVTRKTSVQTSAGAGDAGKIVALNSSGQIDNTMLPSSTDITMTCSENITVGDMINIHDSSGSKVRKASNTGFATRAHGFAKSTATTGNTLTVALGVGINSNVSALTIGSKYYLGTVGGITTTPPTASNTIVQEIGDAKTATELSFILGLLVENE